MRTFRVCSSLLFLCWILMSGCTRDRNGRAKFDEGSYKFNFHVVSVNHPPNSSSTTQTSDFVTHGTVIKTGIHEVFIDFGNSMKITRKLKADGSIVPGQTGESGKFKANSFTYSLEATGLSASSTTTVLGIKQ